MSANMTILSFFKVKVFWKKCYDVMTFVHDITKKFYYVNQILL